MASILVISSLAIPNLVQGQDCEKLKDGKYKVKFDKRFGGSRYVLFIEEGHFTEFREGKEIKGDVQINENCILQLDYHIKWDTVNQLQKQLSKSSNPYFEFQKTIGKRFTFRLTGYAGPHTTSGEGTFVRLD